MKKVIQYIKVASAVALLFAGVSASAQDITAKGGTLTVSTENSGGATANEGSPKLIDNNTGTKYLINPFVSPLTITYQLNTPDIVGQYTLTSGNDASGRDPKTWTLNGSNDGTNWTTLDTKTNQTFASRGLTRLFSITNTTAYRYYRLTITANNGDGLFQLAEWRLLEGIAPEAPTALAGIAASGAETSIAWTDNSASESNFEVERSTDSNTFTKIATLDANVTSYSDTGLDLNTRYWYRMRAINAFGPSAYTSTAIITTLNLSGDFIDITNNGGTLSVSNENSSGAAAAEGSPKLIDNSISTKYLAFGAFPSAGFWVQYQSTSSNEIVTKYTITSANDSPDRDPKNWTFSGSNDGTTWTTLDTRTNQTWSGRQTPKSFVFENSRTVNYYRLLVTANNGSTNIMTQIAELEIFGIPQNAPSVPGNVSITNITEYEISLAWSDLATNETGYEIYRSTNGTEFSLVKTLPAGATSYTDANLRVLTKYYYRIKAIGTSNSILSKMVSGTTLYDERLPLPSENLTAAGISETEIQLTWNDRADIETAFEVERSEDGTRFTKIAALEPHTGTSNTVSYTDTNLKLATLYYYRVRPINNIGQAPYTDVAADTTRGSNTAPAFDAIANVSTCNTTDVQTINLAGITPGTETNQQVALAVTSSNAAMFSDLSVGDVVNGISELKYKVKEGETGEATITVTAKDNGGTLNKGADTFTRTFTINAYELQIAITSDMGDEPVVERGNTLQLTVTGDGNYTYTWADGPGIVSGQNSNVLTIKPTQGYVYKVMASTAEGCTQEAEFTVQLGGGIKLQANNILTPNGDGKNDTWVIYNINTFPGAKVKVLDTAGRVVYSQTDYTNTWDGTYQGSPLAQGVYYYIIDFGSGITPAKGSLTIIRQ